MLLKWLKRSRLRLRATSRHHHFFLLLLAGFFTILYLLSSHSESIPEEILDFERSFLPSAGSWGAPHVIPAQTPEDIQDQIKKYAFNKAVSDQIPLNRALRDYRHEDCRSSDGIPSPQTLGPASVILIFNGEALSALLRTVWSVLNNSPVDLLEEIVLLDDGSTSVELKELLPVYVKARLPSKVKLIRLAEQTGLIQARTAGARVARGRVIVFLDSHCEATKGWLPPLLAPIAEDPSTVTIPTIDHISDKTLTYSGNPHSTEVSVGSFTWSGHFSWASFGGSRSSSAEPVPTPTMAGGLFAMDREFFWRLGAYDEAMIGWGGENLELSFRVWRCHGRMLAVPCSHVGHIFRSFHPYFIPNDSHGLNTRRMAEVWMDDYKRFFYIYRTDLRDKGVPSSQDLASRNSIKEKLHCKSFDWFLKTVIPDKFRMEEEGLFWGRLRSRAAPHMCVDHLQRDGGHNRTPYNLGVYPCHTSLGSSQYYVLSVDGALRNEFSCASSQGASTGVARMMACGTKRGQDPKWTYSQGGALMHSRLCLTIGASFEAGADLLLQPCDEGPRQQWDWEFRR